MNKNVCFNIEDYAKEVGVEVKDLKKEIYKDTECGAWIEWDESGITIGSIVEGGDAEFDRRFNFPFKKDEVDVWIDELEQLVNDAWIEANILIPYEEECAEIARQCEEEGYPSHGANYDLRCESLWNSDCKEDYELMTSK